MTYNNQHSDQSTGLPKEPIDTIVDPLKKFLHIETASGIVLLVAASIAIILANSALAEGFLAFWKKPLGFTSGTFQMHHSIQHWINDGLMAVFFFVVGLEVKRELVMGELQGMRQAALPIAAAIGGMIVPAGIYLALQSGAPGERGWGIPMATDIAFVVGCLAVLGSRIPASLRVLLLSLAIADDIGAILVIAIGYTESLNLAALGCGIIGIGIVIGMMKLGVRNAAAYLIFMVLVWFAFHESGIHATIAGVIFGLLTPAKGWVSESRLATVVDNTRHFLHGDGWSSSGQRYAALRRMERAVRKSISPLERFETDLHPWVGFVIMPVFALANAGVGVQFSNFSDSVAIAVGLGLLAGKPLGIFLLSWLAVKIGVAKLPAGVGWGAVAGSGCLAGIGFTMALFIASLALSGEILDAAKVGILAGSILSAIVGMAILTSLFPKPSPSGS
jgi:NhaA family Na+:H+ antiporter